MRYANLIVDKNINMVNIGDVVQIKAIEKLYYHMGINYDDVVRIKVSELSTYSGEKVVLPINYPMFGFYDLSPYIIPVYLGISVMTATCIEGLRCADNQPIGCRDVHTYQEMTRIGLDAYCSGCLTLTFPKMIGRKGQKKVFWVDAPKQLISYLPEDYKPFVIFETQIYYNENCPNENAIWEQYEKYFEEAALIITSKIHCAMPCLSVGIPVIFACEEASFRYNVLDGITTVYTPEIFEEIDWRPKPVDLEERKKVMIEYATLRLRSVFEDNAVESSLKETYESKLNEFYRRDKEPFKNVTVNAFEQYLDVRYDIEDTFQYILWGVTQITELTYEMISHKYPLAKLVAVIDMYRSVNFHGIDSSPISVLDTLKNAVVLVTAGAVNPIAEHYFKEYDIKKHCVCYNGFYIEDGERLNVHGIFEYKRGTH